MAFDDHFRLSVHAVFTDDEGRILQLKSTYDGERWGLPGGALDSAETIHEALLRECREELGVDIEILYMSGMYFHKAYNSHACLFRCNLPKNSDFKLSSEHSEYRYFSLDELSAIQKQRVTDCLQFDGKVKSARF
jgi:8-oxo-dGTP pyrophosphatase MutT (NUDIX family)